MLPSLWQLFPYQKPRPSQTQAIQKIAEGLENKGKGGIVLVHAPTGSGKSINALVPAIHLAIKKGKRVVVLVNRVTQAERFLEEIRRIKEKIGPSIKIQASVLQSKQSFCIKRDVRQYRDRRGVWHDMPYPVFLANCALARATRECKFYVNSIKKGKPTPELKQIVESRANQAYSVQESVRDGELYRLCPYEIMKKHAATSNIIIGTYGYLFHPNIHENFLQIISASLEDLILIVDEAHNLPEFIRASMRYELSLSDLNKAIGEFRQYSKYAFEQASSVDVKCPSCGVSLEMLEGVKDERIDVRYCKDCRKSKGMDLLEKLKNLFMLYSNYDDGTIITEPLKIFSQELRKKGKKEINIVAEYAGKLETSERKGLTSSIPPNNTSLEEENESSLHKVLKFIEYLEKITTNETETGVKEEFAVSVSKYGDKIKLVIECFDPTLLSQLIFTKSYASILMSATLTPLSYYVDILGLKNKSPMKIELPPVFPEKNRLICYVNDIDIAGKHDLSRPNEKHRKIKEAIKAALESPAKTVGIYSRSYQLAKLVNQVNSNRKIFYTNSKTNPEEVKSFLERNKRAAFVAVQGGRYSEGIEFVNELGSMLDLVVVMGIQFPPPSQIQQAYTEFCKKRFGGKGWDYANRVPAIAKLIQSLGRAQRKETDRVALVILDKRIIEKRNIQYFPDDLRNQIKSVSTSELKIILTNFFRNNYYKQ